MQTLYLPPLTSKKPFNANLEALRGIAALLVVWGHIIHYKEILTSSYTPSGWGAYVGPAHLSVLVFFVLSGYVIGLTHKAPLLSSTILPYLKKRVVRIYPIYFACLIFALCIAPTSYPLKTILSHFTFTQGLFSPLIFEINPIWSLNYEVLFYLLFIPVSYFRINPIYLTILCIITGLVNVYFYPQLNAPRLSSYAFGFAFWLIGLSIAYYVKQEPSAPSYSSMIGNLLLFSSFTDLNVLTTVFNKVVTLLFHSTLSFPDTLPFEKIAIPFQDFSCLPYCLLFISSFISYNNVAWRFFTSLLILLPIFSFYSFYKHFGIHFPDKLLLPSLLYFLSLLVFLFNKPLESVSERILKKIIWLGSISYGVYIIHFPVLVVFSKVKYLVNSPVTFFIAAISFLITTLLAAYWLEKIFQPRIKQLLMR